MVLLALDPGALVQTEAAQVHGVGDVLAAQDGVSL
jgi:hypothetical protein